MQSDGAHRAASQIGRNKLATNGVVRIVDQWGWYATTGAPKVFTESYEWHLVGVLVPPATDVTRLHGHRIHQ